MCLFVFVCEITRQIVQVKGGHFAMPVLRIENTPPRPGIYSAEQSREKSDHKQAERSKGVIEQSRDSDLRSSASP